MKFQNIINLAQKHMFFTSANEVNSLSNVSTYWYGHMGSLVLENIKCEWMHTNIINRDISVSLFKQQDSQFISDDQVYMNVRDYNNNQLPFGIAKVYNEYSEPAPLSFEDKYFNPCNKTSMQLEIYVSPSYGQHYFMHWQRQRKLWWKRMSYSPSRYSLGDVSKSDDGSTIVNILAKYPWGEHNIETISISPSSANSETNIACGRKFIAPVVIKNKMSVETALVSLFCDAFDAIKDSESAILRFHRRIAPFKCALSVTATDTSKEKKDEILMLAFNITKQLRKNGIPTEFLKSSSIPLVSQIQRNDEIGIPYTIILDSSSLTTGVINIRDRDTTLNEEVHISELPQYMKNLVRNF